MRPRHLERLKYVAIAKLDAAGIPSTEAYFDELMGRFTFFLPRANLRVMPGKAQLNAFEPFPPDCDYLAARHFLPWGGWPDNVPEAAPSHIITLHRTKYASQMEVLVTVPIVARYDFSGRWKKHPPSKRRHMRSWRYAPDSWKLRYAPLRGRKHVPGWARHPDAFRRVRLGKVTIAQETMVYAQKGADIQTLLDAHSEKWCRTIVRAFHS